MVLVHTPLRTHSRQRLTSQSDIQPHIGMHSSPTHAQTTCMASGATNLRKHTHHPISWVHAAALERTWTNMPRTLSVCQRPCNGALIKSHKSYLESTRLKRKRKQKLPMLWFCSLGKHLQIILKPYAQTARATTTATSNARITGRHT